MPEAVIMAVQPIQREYDFEGYVAPIIQFEETNAFRAGLVELGQPVVYSVLDFTQAVDPLISFRGQFLIEASGQMNSLRFITKNILAVVQERGTTIDWLNHYMSIPLAQPLAVAAGDVVDISFQYRAGGSIPSLQASVVTSVEQAATFEEVRKVAFA
jgi:predicted RNA methylase